MKKYMALLFVVVVALVAFRFRQRSAGTKSPDIKTIHETLGVPVRISRPRRMNLEERVDVHGELEGLNKLPVVFEVAGRLVSLAPQVGDYVKKGEIVAMIDTRDYKASVDAARAALDVAEARAAKARAGARPAEKAMARARCAEARAALKVASDELSRVEALFAKKAAPQQSLDQARGAYDMARARERQAAQALALVEEGTRKEDIAAALANVALARARLLSAGLLLDKCTLKAPLSGLVTGRFAEPGEYLPTMPTPKKVIDITCMDPVVFVTRISELYVPYLEKDCTIEIRVDALAGERFIGRLHELNPQGEPSSRSFRAEFAIDNPGFRLKPAMFARSSIRLRKSEGAVTVPSYILRDPRGIEAVENAPDDCVPADIKTLFRGAGRRAVVFGVRNSRAAALPVLVGIVQSGRAEIVKGIGLDEKIIVDGFEELKAGQKVDCIEEEAR